MNSVAQLTLRDAYLAHDGEWVAMELAAPERGEDWEQTGVIVYHGQDLEEAHEVARTHFKCSETAELVVFQGTMRLIPGDHFRRICESLSYRRGLDPSDLEL